MFGEFEVGPVGPDEEEAGPAFIPKQSSGNIEFSDQEKQEIAFLYTVGSRKISNFMAVLKDPSKMKMIIEDLLPETGLTYIAGLSGTGKTILAVQIMVNLVLGKPTMTWKMSEEYEGRRLRCLILSLEMNRKQLQRRFEDMYPNLTTEEEKLLEENLLTYDEPDPFELWNAAHVLELAKIIKQCKVDVILIDSASVAFAEELTNQKQVNESVKNLYRLRSRLSVSMFIVAHTRKPPPGIASNPEEATLNELFGHSGVAQSADGIVILVEDEKARKATIKNGDPEKTEKLVHVVNAKSRFSVNSGAFKSYLTAKVDVDKGHPLMFKRNAIPIAMTEEQKKKLKSTKVDLADALNSIDFDDF